MPFYSVLIEQDFKSYNITDIDEEDLNIIVKAYLTGEANITLSGKEYNIWPNRIAFFEYQEPINEAELRKTLSRDREMSFAYIHGAGYLKQGFNTDYFFTDDFFLKVCKGENITKKLIGNKKFGQDKEELDAAGVTYTLDINSYVDESIIYEIRKLPTTTFDFSKLLALLNEINENYNNKNYYSVAFLLRSTLDHVPPLFAKNTFAEVCNQHPFGKSDKNLVLRLQNLSRDISDRELHTIIAKKVPLITETEIDFKHSLAALLKEIVRLHH